MLIPGGNLGPVVLATADENMVGATRRALAEFVAEGPSLTTVSDLADCMVALRLLHPSFLILDDALDAPGAPPLRAVLAEHPRPPVAYIAAHHSLDFEREVRRLGVLFYFARPRTPQQLEALLESIVRALKRSVQ